jgi:hypothetical protein
VVMQVDISTIAAAIAGGGGAGAAVVWLAREWISTRIKESIKAEYAVEHEHLKAEIARQEATRAVATGAFAGAHLASHERRLDALEKFWAAIVKFTGSAPDVIGYLDVMTRDEVRKAMSNPKVATMIVAITSESELARMVALNQGVEPIRFLLGEAIYNVFFVYRALSIRFVNRARSAVSTGVLLPWQEDDLMDQLLRQVFQVEYISLLKEKPAGAWGEVRVAMEQKMLTMMADIVSGKSSANVGLEQAMIVDRLASEAARPAV